MIAKLTGYLDSTGLDWVVIDVHGVGYCVYCSLRTQQYLREVGDGVVSVAVETVIRDDRIYLYGFTSVMERDWFRLLMTVQGVGARVALSLLGVLSCEELGEAIMSHDQALLLRAEGIGTKLAKRILLELRERVEKMPFLFEGRGVVSDGGMEDIGEQALLGLVNLGYSRSEVYRVVTEISTQMRPTDVATLIRYSLQRLDQKERRGG